MVSSFEFGLFLSPIFYHLSVFGRQVPDLIGLRNYYLHYLYCFVEIKTALMKLHCYSAKIGLV